MLINKKESIFYGNKITDLIKKALANGINIKVSIKENGIQIDFTDKKQITSSIVMTDFCKEGLESAKES